MLTAISLIAMIAAIGMADFSRGRRNSELQMAAQKLANDTRVMQSNALALQDFNGSSPEGGWGIYFNRQGSQNDYYRQFADVDGDHFFDSGEEYRSDIILPKSVFVESILVDGGGAITGQTATVVYEPPNPKTHLCHQNGNDCSPGEFTVILSNDVQSINVVFNKFGLVDISDTY